MADVVVTHHLVAAFAVIVAAVKAGAVDARLVVCAVRVLRAAIVGRRRRRLAGARFATVAKWTVVVALALEVAVARFAILLKTTLCVGQADD